MTFNIPIVLFLFRRSSTLHKIIARLRTIRPEKIYLLADGPRNEKEMLETDKVREMAEKLIDWECELVKHYSDSNIGVIENIGGGAKWVFEREDMAIFIEDDNLPEITFFDYCKELLEKYKDNDKILWICGTNYLGTYKSQYSYMFTQHLLPCGWASWSNKFMKMYDIYLETLQIPNKLKCFEKTYHCKELLKQQEYSIKRTRYLIENDLAKASWDYQMLFSLRSNNMFGISPVVNQITNIGLDEYSTHGNTKTITNKLTNRFCNISSAKLDFPLKHPPKVEIDDVYENAIGDIILMPIKDRIYRSIATFCKLFLRINKYTSFAEFLKK